MSDTPYMGTNETAGIVTPVITGTADIETPAIPWALRKMITKLEGERDAARKDIGELKLTMLEQADEIQLLDAEIERLTARNAHLEGLLAKEQR